MRLYFTTVGEGRAASALAEERFDEAIPLFDEIAATSTAPELILRARFMAAYLAGRQGDHARALKELPGLAEQLPLVADTARETAAIAALKLGEYDRAWGLALLIPGSSTLADSGALIKADAKRGLEQWAVAAEAYEQYLVQWPEGSRQAEAHCRIIECKTRLATRMADRTLAREALTRLDQRRAQQPTGYWTQWAAKNEAALLKVLGEKPPRVRREQRAAHKAYDKALNLLHKKENLKAQRFFGRAIYLSRRKGNLWCRARLNQAIAVSRQRDHERAGSLYRGTARDCKQPDIKLRALYRGAKSFQSSGHYNEAIRLYGEVEAEFPDHSYADDARLHAARCYLSQDKKDQFLTMLRQLPRDYPQGDMRAEALWTLAHEAIRNGRLDEAHEILEEYYELFPREEGWYAAGRSGYWLGRVEELLGEPLVAARRYEQVIGGFPFTFYMVMAYNRLVAIDRRSAHALMAKLAPLKDQQTAGFDAKILEDYPALASGVELLRLGLVSRAKQAFSRLLKDPYPPPGLHWFTAALLRSVGQFHEAKTVAVQADGGWRQRYPVGRDFAPWQAAYPPAYQEEVETVAQQQNISKGLIWAIMREESGFDPQIESWANAIGLMQLILPTARGVGSKLGIRVTPKTLRQPEVNITLGTAYLAHLKKLFHEHPVLMIAGYNAGQGAVQRWLKERSELEVDAFVEQIPYSQTRGYTKRVIGALAAYSFLYGDTPSVVQIDMRLIPESKKNRRFGLRSRNPNKTKTVN